MDKSVIVKDAEATKDSFSLKRLLSRLNLDDADNVLLNWHRFDNIDEIRTDDLCNMFSDIWYPSSGDLHIFNSNCDWILSIEHHGVISFLRFERKYQVGTA